MNSLHARGHTVEQVSVSQADVVTARNILAQCFLESDAERFIGIDDDIGLTPEVAELLIAQDRECLSVLIPQRVLDLSRYASAIRKGMGNKEAQYAAAPYIPAPHPDFRLSEANFIKVARMGTGFYILKKQVLRTLIETGGVEKQNLDLPGASGVTYSFFNNISENGSHLGEDYSFSQRLIRAGVSLYCYAGPGILHTGSTTYST